MARVFRGLSLAAKARMACTASRHTQRWTTWAPRVHKGQDGASPRHGVFAAISMAGMTLPVSWMPVVQGVKAGFVRVCACVREPEGALALRPVVWDAATAMNMMRR